MKKWIVPAVIFILLIIATALSAYSLLFKPIKLSEPLYIYIDENRDYQAVVEQLTGKKGLPPEKTFQLIAERMDYPDNIRTGKYEINDGMTVIEMIRVLRSGSQTPINLTFNNIRTKEQLAQHLSEQLMIDSLTIISSLFDSAVAQEFGFDDYTFQAMFIPNTYEVYWNISKQALLQRMKREYERFWNDSRRKKAADLGLTPIEISTLASIVEEEAYFEDEYPIIAGLYINRLQRNMPLQADPTVKYAVGDFKLQRILHQHLEIESPYNTYLHTGLPPGPIRIPSIKAIDAVLNPAEHHYLYMCAKPDFSGRHNFANSQREHARNARAYQQALNERGIY